MVTSIAEIRECLFVDASAQVGYFTPDLSFRCLSFGIAKFGNKRSFVATFAPCLGDICAN